MTWSTSRRPGDYYTRIGIARLKCIVKGCKRKARYEWAICADKNVPRPICVEHDIELNAMVLRWAGHPDATKLIEAYKRRDHS